MGNTTIEMLKKAVTLIGETLQEQGLEVDIIAAIKRFNECIQKELAVTK